MGAKASMPVILVWNSDLYSQIVWEKWSNLRVAKVQIIWAKD
jgi:hypothetical protein